jgi:SAM-dependent methyltransferase
MTNPQAPQKESIRQFTGKYEGAGGVIGRRLLDGFFAAVLASIPRDARVAAELGCGAGFSTERIHGARPDLSLSASDVDPELVALAGARVPDVPISVESLYELRRESGSVDLTFTLEVLEHLERPFDALREIHRVTRRHAIVTVPREPIWRVMNMARGKYLADLGNTPGHLNHWSARGLRRFVSPLFEVLDTRTPLPWTVLLLQKRSGAPGSDATS